MFFNRKIQHRCQSHALIFIYKFNKRKVDYEVLLEEQISKKIWENPEKKQRRRLALQIKIYYKLLYYEQYWHMQDQWNRKENPETNPTAYKNLVLIKAASQIKRENSFFKNEHFFLKIYYLFERQSV